MSADLHPQYCPSQALVANPDLPRSPPGDSFIKMMPMKKQMKKTGTNDSKNGTNAFFSQKLKRNPEACH